MSAGVKGLQVSIGTSILGQESEPRRSGEVAIETERNFWRRTDGPEDCGGSELWGSCDVAAEGKAKIQDHAESVRGVSPFGFAVSFKASETDRTMARELLTFWKTDAHFTPQRCGSGRACSPVD
jgi:hypothetical protein